VSQQPYPGQPDQPGQPGQPQPGGYPPPGQQGGYPQGGYQQPQQPPQPQRYGGYQGSPPPSRSSGSGSGSGNPLTVPATLAPILLYVGYAVIALGVIAAIVTLTITGDGAAKFAQFLEELVTGFGFGGILIALAAFLKSRPTT
jgi:hypothetical protein